MSGVPQTVRCRYCASPLAPGEASCPACGGSRGAVSGADLFERHSRAVEADHASWRRGWADIVAQASPAPSQGVAAVPSAEALSSGLEGEVHGMLNLLLLHGGFSPFRGLKVNLPEGTRGARLTFSASPEVLARPDLPIDPVSRRLEPPPLVPRPEAFFALEESVPGTLEVGLEADGRPMGTRRFELAVQPAGTWLERPGSEAALAGAVTPNAASVVEVLGALPGNFIAYQDTDRRRLRRELEGLYGAVGALGLHYVSSAPAMGDGQRILFPAELLRRGRGCCLDLVLLEAALLEGLGYRPLLLFFRDGARGHAATAVWTSEVCARQPVLRDAALLERLLGDGELLAWDSTQRFEGGDLAAAEATGRGWLPHLDYALDLGACRREGFRPLAGGWP